MGAHDDPQRVERARGPHPPSTSGRGQFESYGSSSRQQSPARNPSPGRMRRVGGGYDMVYPDISNTSTLSTTYETYKVLSAGSAPYSKYDLDIMAEILQTAEDAVKHELQQGTGLGEVRRLRNQLCCLLAVLQGPLSWSLEKSKQTEYNSSS